MGAIGAPELQPLNFSVKFESISTLGKMLAHFVPEQTSLWVNPTWYRLTDGVLFFGFERYQFSLPVPDVFQKKSADYCLVPRKQLTESVALLAAVEKDPDARVEIAVPGESGPTQRRCHIVERRTRGFCVSNIFK
jgi:hypothetical protein